MIKIFTPKLTAAADRRQSEAAVDLCQAEFKQSVIVKAIDQG